MPLNAYAVAKRMGTPTSVTSMPSPTDTPVTNTTKATMLAGPPSRR
jgi:hypothetical protein